MTPGIVRTIFRDHYPSYRQGRNLSLQEQKAAYKIATCGTREAGTHRLSCDQDDYHRWEPNSCRHRLCPRCGQGDVFRWVLARQARSLNCAYHQAIFTIPDRLHVLWQFNRAEFANLLFKASWDTLREFYLDPKWIGGIPGAIGAFHSWGEMLNIHAHIHYLITAGGLGPDGIWRPAAHSFLFPARAMGIMFRGKFLSYLEEALRSGDLIIPPDQTLDDCLDWLRESARKRWNVRIQPRHDVPDGLLNYLAHYLRRGPMAEGRIAAYDGQTVTIRYKRTDEHTSDTFQLSAHEFIRRMLEHAAPKGFRMTRCFGLFHPRCREKKLDVARAQCGQSPAPDGEQVKDLIKEKMAEYPSEKRVCPICGAKLKVTDYRYPYIRGSPLEMVA